MTRHVHLIRQSDSYQQCLATIIHICTESRLIAESVLRREIVQCLHKIGIQGKYLLALCTYLGYLIKIAPFIHIKHKSDLRKKLNSAAKYVFSCRQCCLVNSYIVSHFVLQTVVVFIHRIDRSHPRVHYVGVMDNKQINVNKVHTYQVQLESNSLFMIIWRKLRTLPPLMISLNVCTIFYLGPDNYEQKMSKCKC